MGISRRAFIGNAAAFALISDGLAAAAPGGSAFSHGGKASDFLMCRRLYLDICGRLPSRQETEAYVVSKDSHKLEKLVDTLIDSEDYADYWAMRMCDCLRVKSEFPINLWPNAVYVYHRRIRQAVANDEPWPDFARALLCGRGSNFRVPEANFLRATALKVPEGFSEAASVSFLMEPSKKYAKYFSRVAIKKTKEWKEEIVYLKDGPEDAVPEAFMDELEGPLASKFYATPVRRAHYWIFCSEPKQSTLDDWKSRFKHGGFRMKPLLRYVFTSSAYKADPIRGKFPPRRLDAEVLDDVICTLTGTTHSFESIAPEPYSFLPPARKSVLIEDGSITSAFLLLFGRPARDSGMLEERKNEITAKQRLYLYNSAKLWNALGHLVAEPEFRKLSYAAKVEDLYMRFLCRPPVKAEMDFLSGKDGSAPVDARGVAWHLLNSREFLYRI